MVIQHQEIIAFDSPKTIYNNPSQKYIAALFEDVNEIKIAQKEHLLYVHQLKIVEKSLYKAIVLNAYFKGNYWLIEANFESQIVFLSHPSEIKKGTEIRLSFEF